MAWVKNQLLIKLSPVVVPGQVAVSSRQRTCWQGPWLEQSPCCDLGLQPPRPLAHRSAALTCTEKLQRSSSKTTNTS